MALNRRNNPRPPRRNEDAHRINERITAPQVRVVWDGGAEVLSIKEALKKADESEMDLVEISPNADPPVCKIIDYKKFLFEQKKKQKELKAKQSKVVIKEIRMGPNTEDHDFKFKLKHAISFLKDGAKVKAYVFFKGRSIVFKERGEILLLKFAQELEEYGTLEQMPKLEGKKMLIMINPKKK
ncbi:MAG: translation initiation factor IF-3 [Crocinitomicaceae bacterium]|nr:translation initiation factor IF-3 [Crocinitomicaceae bacterium]